ncbi:hypothetical protein ALC56_07613 [Trachymyrmex septentrionalis]|uniref:Uncharacterized protein n=1 Tax=Trachymyrmex septentrionalis TaxID=34720 RepID=A0A195FD71_9HYME|nr:hypothetical protein ALC56_07613 [Trachymyrmex septentrionalis]
MITNIHTTSSIISFKADTLRMKISGTNVVQRPVGDTSGIPSFRLLHHVTFVIFLHKCDELYLHKCDEQEETVAVATELFEQEQGLMRGIDENYPFFAIILLRGWLIVTLSHQPCIVLPTSSELTVAPRHNSQQMIAIKVLLRSSLNLKDK